MTTLTLNLELDESLVLAYRQAPVTEKDDLRRLFERLLANRFRKQAIEEMILHMDEIGREAEANGLTEDIVDEILAES